jgi:hypothetical protein
MLVASTNLAGSQTSTATAEPPPRDQAAISAGAPYPAWLLEQLFGDKTWLWENGGAHFATKGRRFKAVVKADGAVTATDGRWSLSDAGVMCLRAPWSDAAGTPVVRTCFAHRVLDGVLYQRRDPDGPWYVFRSNPPLPTDEANKLVAGDQLK